MRYKPEVEVLKNSKTKCYTDGTTNTVCCKTGIFKDKSDIYLESEKNKELGIVIENERIAEYIDYIHAKGISLDEAIERRKKYQKELPNKKKDEFNKFLTKYEMKVDDFMELIEKRDSPDFLIELAKWNVTLDDFDDMSDLFRKYIPQAKSRNTQDPRSDSLKRAKDSIFDYVLNNDFDYFFTGTINPDELDSKDPKALLKPVIKWLNNQQQRSGLQYLMIAERHKKGGIHFHGLFKADSLKLEDSGTKLYKGHKKPISNDRAQRLGLTDGRTVYNLVAWKFGFSTCIELTGDRLNTAFYVTKYITKDCKKIFGKFFWHSYSLKKPIVIVEDMDFDSIQSVERNGFKYQFKRGNEYDKERNISDL